MTEIREGDTVLIGYDYPTTREQVDRMRRELEEWFPGVEFRFICGTVQAVMHGEEVEEYAPGGYVGRLGDLPRSWTHGPDMPRRIRGRHVEDVPLPPTLSGQDPFKPIDKCPHGRTAASRRLEPCPNGFPGCQVDS